MIFDPPYAASLQADFVLGARAPTQAIAVHMATPPPATTPGFTLRGLSNETAPANAAQPSAPMAANSAESAQ